MFVAPPPDPEPASDAPPSLGLQRHSTVVIMARDEADRAVVGHKQGSSDGLFSPAINGRAVRGRESLIGASGEAHYHEHPNSTLLPHHNYDDEFSTDHIDYLTLRFKHLEQNAANQAATSALKSNKAAPAHSTAHPASRLIDKTLEGGFLADFFDRYHRRIIKAILTATVIWALYVVNDVQKNDQGLRKNFQETLIIRFVNCGIGVICAILLMTPFIQKRKLLMPVVGFAMITFGVAQIVFGLWDENELDPSYSVVMILIPSTSSTLFKQRFIFTVVFQAAILTLYIIITYAFDSFHSSSDLVLTALGLLFANCLFAMHAYRREYKMRKDYLMKCQLEREEIRSQNLLLRMLPGSVIAKLREGSEFIFYKHDEVTLLFAHINDWDTHVHAMTAMQVIRMLNSLFTRFDLLCDEHGVYKVETIGDVYLVSSGCPVEYTRDDHVDAIGAFALDMIAQAKLFMVEHVRDVKSGSVQVTDPKSKNYGLRKKHGTGHVSKLCPVQLRLGMNSGAIISGVVGVKYPRFRLMGDTINTASRMSTTALADQIQMSTRSWEKLNKSWFETKYRGEITVKGKGEMKTYLLLTKVNLICPLPRSLEQVQLANGTLSLEAFASNENLQSVGKTHGGLMVESPQAGKGSLGPRQSPSTHARPSPRQTQSSSNLSHLASPKAAAPGIIEMLPTQLPGVPEMLQKLRSGEVAEELDGESRSTSSMSGNLREREESTPSRLDPLDGDELGETAAEGEGAAVRDAKSEDDGTARSLPGKRALAMTPPPNEKRGLTVSTASPHAAPAGSPLRSARRGSHFGGTGSTHLLAKTGSAVSTNGRSTTINPSSSAGDNGRDISTSSRSKTKMVITAVDHQNTFKSVRLFSFGPMNAILKPSRRWWEVLSQNFTTDPVLEYEFRHVYGKEYRATNVWAVNFMWIFLLPLSMYDVLNNTELDSSLVAYSWIVRLFGLAVGVWFYRSSKKPEYVRYMQQMTTITVSVVSVVYIYTTSITSALLKSYGVSFVLVIMCLVCMFIGLRFYGALFSCLTIAIAWIIATVSFEDGLPGIGSVLLAGGVMYLETCWNMENDSRHDFVRFRKLYHERMSTHAFLSNMLPAMVFEGLKREDSALVAHERPAASVLFSDIVGFTSIAATLKPEDVVAVLNVMFSIFDTLSQKHLVYKVETIGDAYVACTNVVLQRDDHAKCLVDFALAMQKATKRMYTPSHQQIVIRVGLHTGSVVAGVVGRKMPRYHLFGETVTIAELMEQKGVPGMVALSHACYSAMPASTVTTEYECKPLEPVPHEQHMVKRYTIERAKGYPASIPAGDQFSMKTGRDRRASIKGGTARTPHQSLHTLHGSNGLGLTSSQIDLLQQPISPPAPLTPLPADDSSESASPPHHGVLAVTVTTESTTDREGEKSEDSGSAKDMKGTAAIAPLLASPSVQVTVARTGHGRGDSIAFSPPAHTKTPSAPSPVFLPGQLDEDINLPE